MKRAPTVAAALDSVLAGTGVHAVVTTAGALSAGRASRPAPAHP